MTATRSSPSSGTLPDLPDSNVDRHGLFGIRLVNEEHIDNRLSQ